MGVSTKEKRRSEAEEIEEAIQAVDIMIRNAYRVNKSMKAVHALSIARRALKKQMPMDVKNKIREPVCPACYSDIPLEPIDHSVTTYCIYCGQAINWEGWKWTIDTGLMPYSS